MNNSHLSTASARRGALTGKTMAVVLLAGSAIPASAHMPDLSALSGAARVADDELSEMHGKFITPKSVSYFGITMLSSWQDASGVTTLANLVFSVDFLPGGNGNPVPQLMIAWSREGDPAMDVTDTHEGYFPYIPAQDVLGVGALETFAGAAQANVIAGADNRTLNGMQVMIVPSSVVPAMTQRGMTSATGPVDLVFADGDELHFRMADNQIGIVMIGNGGLDSSSQLAGGDIGQLLQQSILNSDNNAIENRASVIFGVDALQNVQIVRAQEALSAMKGHGF
ncbi:hypothetical protein M3P36_09220 [Altererythrobacter sp. KTW20L]|uniref:hypothetical protein n=1 Tax=Altererythrobacter sp. KTW20L TaxID=2942210 RepID=UPI0020BFD9AD|nr:hypothetical protein [Altererythrobacter sp. KTW20L]MCL6251218.1 hypothetical protein [Altererythrobacter sp. KTW20L]